MGLGLLAVFPWYKSSVEVFRTAVHEHDFVESRPDTDHFTDIRPISKIQKYGDAADRPMLAFYPDPLLFILDDENIYLFLITVLLSVLVMHLISGGNKCSGG